MKLVTFKKLALLATAGVLLQVGGCGAIVVQILANEIFSKILAGILGNLLGTNDTTTTQ
ncbi:MAG: hypothetical protein HZB38_01295 [Planctomycetes bacterium]|nr:hypothetical protein [Planctomycetota bacterium]